MTEIAFTALAIVVILNCGLDLLVTQWILARMRELESDVMAIKNFADWRNQQERNPPL